MRAVAGLQRKAVPLLSATVGWENSALEEPTVRFESNTWKMWFTGGWASSALGYATCPGGSDPTVTGNWTKYASNPVLGQGGSGYASAVSGNNVYKVASTYYCMFYAVGTSSNLYIATSSDGISWNTPTTAITAGSLLQGYANSYVWNDGSWHLIGDGWDGSNWRMYYGDSSDGLAWTARRLLPSLLTPNGLIDGGMWVLNDAQPIRGRYWLMYHSGSGNFSDILNIAWTTDPTLDDWHYNAGELLTHQGSTYEFEQVADPSVVEQGGVTYVFYDGVNNTGISYINVAIYPGTISEMVRSLGGP